MPTDLITRREQALTRHDTALERWPDRAGAGFATELAAVADELGKVAALSSKTWNCPALAGKYLLVRNDTEAVCYEVELAK